MKEEGETLQTLGEYLIERVQIELRDKKLGGSHTMSITKEIRDELSTLWGISRQTFYAWVRQKYVVLEVKGRIEAFKPLTQGGNDGDLP